MSGNDWQKEAREPVARAICEELDNLPFGELDNPHRMQARESYLADADIILTALAPIVAAEVARAEAQGKVTALRDARAELTEIGQWKRLQGLAGVRDSCMAHARDHALAVLLNRAAAIETEAGER